MKQNRVEMLGTLHAMNREDYSTLVFRCDRHGRHEIKVPVVIEFGVEKIFGHERAECPRCGFEMVLQELKRSEAANKAMSVHFQSWQPPAAL
jgi:hypothetical protein